jgi:hypothetical protein
MVLQEIKDIKEITKFLSLYILSLGMRTKVHEIKLRLKKEICSWDVWNMKGKGLVAQKYRKEIETSKEN